MHQLSNNKIEAYVANQFDKLVHDDAMFPPSADKNDWEWQAIIKELSELKGKKILDIGCGKGKFCQLFAQSGDKPTGIDISEELLRSAKKLAPTITYLVGSATNIPAKDGEFDVAICVEVLEHVPNLEKAIAEMARVLKKDGTLIIIDKNLYGLHPVWPYPAVIEKIWKESHNQWMYPKDAPYREKWFSPRKLKRDLSKEFSAVSVSYPVRSKFIGNTLKYAVAPWLSYDALWKATK